MTGGPSTDETKQSEQGTSIRCGLCGSQLKRVGEDHNCPEGLRVAAFMATGNPAVFSDDIKQDGDSA